MTQPRTRHRHSREHVARHRHRDGRTPKADHSGCTCLLCVRRGGVDARYWRKVHEVPTPCAKRTHDGDRADREEQLT